MISGDIRIGKDYDFKSGGVVEDMSFEKEKTLLEVRVRFYVVPQKFLLQKSAAIKIRNRILILSSTYHLFIGSV